MGRNCKIDASLRRILVLLVCGKFKKNGCDLELILDALIAVCGDGYSNYTILSNVNVYDSNPDSLCTNLKIMDAQYILEIAIRQGVNC